MAEELRILYEDPYLVVCVKPVGVLSEDSESGRSLPRMLAEHYRQAGKPDYIATVHRLDKIVGGVMVLSRRREVTGRLTAAIAAPEITKEYLAVLRGHPQEPAATLTDLLFRDASHNKSYVVKRMRKGVREARLSYEEVGARRNCRWCGCSSIRGVPIRSGCSLPPMGCRCWGISVTAARRPAARRRCGRIIWASGIPSPGSRWM